MSNSRVMLKCEHCVASNDYVIIASLLHCKEKPSYSSVSTVIPFISTKDKRMLSTDM